MQPITVSVGTQSIWRLSRCRSDVLGSTYIMTGHCWPVWLDSGHRFCLSTLSSLLLSTVTCSFVFNYIISSCLSWVLSVGRKHFTVVIFCHMLTVKPSQKYFVNCMSMISVTVDMQTVMLVAHTRLCFHILLCEDRQSCEWATVVSVF